VPRGNPGLGHMAPSHLPTNMPRVQIWLVHATTTMPALSHATFLPHQPTTMCCTTVWPCHVIYTDMPCVTLAMVPHVTISLIHLSTINYIVSANASLQHHLYSRTTCTISYLVSTVQTVHTVQSTNFASLEKRTDHDILVIRCPFEPVQVALGSYRWGLHTRLFWIDSEHFDF